MGILRTLANQDGASAAAGVNTLSSPAGPGAPLDGSFAVNTYDGDGVTQADQAAGRVDWQDALNTPMPLPNVAVSVPQAESFGPDFNWDFA